MGGGFLWGLSLMLFVFNGGFTKHPQPGSSIPLTMGAVGAFV